MNEFPEIPPESAPELPARFNAARWYTPQRLWSKLARNASIVGRKGVLSALTLFHCLRDHDTPAWARGVIVGALGYLVLPVDLIPDIIPGFGYTDDWAVIVSALATVAAYVKDIHKSLAAEQTERLLGNFGRYRPATQVS